MRRLVSLGIYSLVVLVGACIVLLLVSLISDAVFPAQNVAREADTESVYPPADDVYQVEVRNGVGVSGVAERMRTYLRTKGYDVVEVGNHTNFDLDETLVVDRVDNMEIARQVAASLGLPEDRIRQDVRSEYHLDVSIVLGKDYGLIPPFSADSLLQLP